MSLFKENRFVFKTPGAPGEAVVPAPPVVPEDAAATAGVALDAGQQTVDGQSDSSLDRLRAMIGVDFEKRIDALKLNGKTFSASVPENTEEFVTNIRKAPIAQAILVLWKDYDLSYFKSLGFGLEDFTDEEEVKKGFADFTAAYILGRMKAHFDENYKPHYEEFIKEKNLKGKVSYIVTFNSLNAEAKVAQPENFDTKYKKYVDTKYPNEKKATAKEKSDKEKLVQARASALEKSPLGKLLVAWKIVPEGGFVDVINGNNMWAVIIVGFFGGDKLLDGAYAKAKEGIDPKYAKILEPFEKKAQALPFLSVANLKVDTENPGGLSPVSFDVEKFGKLINGQDNIKMPEQGLILKDEYPVPEGWKLIITGGTLTIPKEKTISIHEGDDVAAGDEPEVLQSVGPIIGKIPAGTIISGTAICKLEEISN